MAFTLPRLHLAEIEDQPWCPVFLRDAMTDYLRLTLSAGRFYDRIRPHLQRGLAATGARRIVDLCSGGGGPWARLSQQLEGPDGQRLEVCLSDRFPNAAAAEELRALSDGRVRLHPEPVDARRVPPELDGFRTLFTAFHHFEPDDARAILADAAAGGRGIAVFEVSHRSLRALVLLGLSVPLIVLVGTPFIRPFRWSRLVFTYLLPLIPLCALFDGLVSCLRTYTPAELRELTRDLAPGYHWEMGEERLGGHPSPIPITYLVGYPTTPARGAVCSASQPVPRTAPGETS